MSSDVAEVIITPEAVRQLLREGGIREAEITAENGQQGLRSADDWWTVVLGSGYRWTLEQMDSETAARVREVNLKAFTDEGTDYVETNVIYAIATKR